ncbi:MAG: hypothetical protein FWH57_12480 [Oscillospiraceae bacterium]|nr:hypothetical protein [Oscillospiraceae bacterium]
MVRFESQNWRYVLLFTLVFVMCIVLIPIMLTTKKGTHSILINGSESIGELEQLDLDKEAVVPLFLPTNIENRGINYNKTGLTATIVVDQEVIVSFMFTRFEVDTLDFPSVGEALVSEDNGQIVIRYRMTNTCGCVISSDSLPEQELVRIIESFVIKRTF